MLDSISGARTPTRCARCTAPSFAYSCSTLMGASGCSSALPRPVVSEFSCSCMRHTSACTRPGRSCGCGVGASSDVSCACVRRTASQRARTAVRTCMHACAHRRNAVHQLLVVSCALAVQHSGAQRGGAELAPQLAHVFARRAHEAEAQVRGALRIQQPAEKPVAGGARGLEQPGERGDPVRAVIAQRRGGARVDRHQELGGQLAAQLIRGGLRR